MRIVNAMFGCGLGGIEQTFVDYCETIAMQGHEVVAVLHPAAKIRPQVEALGGVEVHCIPNIGAWDVVARFRLARLLRRVRADAAILHANRAVALMRDAAVASGCRTVGVTHNYRLSRQIGLDGFFATTEDLRQALVRQGQAGDSIHLIPNMIRLDAVPPHPRERGAVPVIGSMGRFVQVKGYPVFIEALALLRQRGVEFSARLGGDGEEREALRSQAAALGLGDVLEFSGWVRDKTAFFGSIDMFCLPSLSEAFGLVLLEAFAHKVPVVTSDAPGPADISTDGVDALVVPRGDAFALADGLQRLLEDAALAGRLASAAANTVAAYGLDTVGKKICTALERIIADGK